jgi:hypothetical protein
MSNGLDIALMKDPFGEWRPEAGDHHTDIAFSDPEWGSFFFDTLKATLTTYLEDEGYESYDARYQTAFKESLQDFPLLARISKFYRDTAFAPDEIDQLDEELNRAAQLPLTHDAKAFLEGMLLGCRMARDEKMGISLLSS